jgi:hypothetical protein
MFNSLDEEIRRDEEATTTPRQRCLFYATVLATAIVLFGGLWAGIQLLE